MKKLTHSQVIGEIGEAAARLQFLNIGFQFDGRSRLEAGIDGIAEVMDDGKPLARMIAVQVKATDVGKYTSENDEGFTYLLRSEDLEYWRGSNLPLIIVLYRRSDDSFFWQEIEVGVGPEERRLTFNKQRDALTKDSVDRLAALTVPKAGFGYYVPPLGGGEEALVNLLPIILPTEVFVATTQYSGAKAAAILLDGDEAPRFDWVINGGTFWSFTDPRQSCCRSLVDLDQVEGIETDLLAFHEDEVERNKFAHLLRQTLRHQTYADLRWDKERKLLYFKAEAPNTPRTFFYDATKKKTDADVVNVVRAKNEEARVEFVRHHAFIPRFENLYDQWFLTISPTYFFTTDGFIPHSYPQALLAGKKRMDKSASLRGQVIMWHRYLTESDRAGADLFGSVSTEPRLKFGEPPSVALPTRVPEDAWATPKKTAAEEDDDDAQSLMRFA
ncbi:hypothetical protein ACVIGB_008937 [Bradyrhizobium sp. USDA 4341]